MQQVSPSAHKLNSLFDVNPQEQLNSYKWSSGWRKTAGVLAALAVVAIAATVITFSVLGTGGTAILPAVLFVTCLTIPFLGFGAKTIWILSTPFAYKQMLEQGVVNKQKELLKKYEWEGVFPSRTNHGTVFQALRQLDSTKANEAIETVKNQCSGRYTKEAEAAQKFIPLLARFHALLDRINSSYKQSQTLITNAKQAEEGSAREDKNWLESKNILEYDVYSTALEAAFVFHVIMNPLNTKKSLIGSSKEDALGYTTPKNPTDRQKVTDVRGHRSYFVFNEKAKAPITVDFMEIHSDLIAQCLKEQSPATNSVLAGCNDAYQLCLVQQIQLISNRLFAS